MPTYRAEVPTRNASRYLQQLCRHWAQQATADYTATAGRVAFAGWQVEMEARRESLDITIDVPDAKMLDRCGKFVSDRLQRIALQETLFFEWF